MSTATKVVKAESLKVAKAAIKAASTVAIELTKEGAIALSKEAGAAARTMQTAREVCNKAAKKLHDAKIKIGNARTCSYAQAFTAARFEGVTGLKNLKEAKHKALGAFRYAVETGKPYDENRARKEKKKAAAGSGAIMVTIPAGATEEQAAAAVAKLIGKMQEVDTLINLASFLTDALLEAGYDAAESEVE